MCIEVRMYTTKGLPTRVDKLDVPYKKRKLNGPSTYFYCTMRLAFVSD